MFTGIIEETGKIRAVRGLPRGAVITVSARQVTQGMKPGDSVAVNGVCLTAVRASPEAFSCDLSSETLRRTSFATAVEGTVVNLERALEVGARLGGHFVMGHVDGVGHLEAKKSDGDGAEITVRFPRELERYLVLKGSIAVDGISLTIASLEVTRFTVAVVPYTLKATNLGSLKPGAAVNLEVDVLGKYVERLIQAGRATEPNSNWTLEYLKGQGF